MGAFPEAVHMFAPLNVAVIPTQADAPSVPRMRNGNKLGVRGSLELAKNPRFAEANAGIWTGKRSGITVVDIDSNDPAIIAEAVARFGDTPLKVQTPSGGMHLYFRHNGEPRSIRPFGKEFPVDTLGNGLCVIPPSRRPQTAKKSAGEYRIVEGEPEDIIRLPKLNSNVLPMHARTSFRAPACRALTETDSKPGSDIGIRNETLFDFCRSVAPTVGSRDELEALALARNAQLDPPLSDEELRRGELRGTVGSVWRYKQKGRLLLPGCEATVRLTRSEFDALDHDNLAMGLLVRFRLSYGAPPGKIFPAPTVPLAKLYGVRVSRVTVTLDRLIALGFLIRRRKGGNWVGDLSLYSLTSRR